MVTGADALLEAARARRIRAVTVLGVELHLRQLTLDERIAIGDRTRAGEKVSPREYLLLALCDAEGAPLMTAEQIDELCAADGYLAEKAIEEVFRMIGALPEVREAAAKN